MPFLLVISLFFAGSLRAAPPQRIVSTGPAITETLYALGLGPNVVGVSTFCHFPADAQKKTKVGTYLEPNLEVIASLKPDLVIVEKLPTRATSTLGRLGVRTLEVQFGDVAGIMRAMETIATAAGDAAAGRKLTASIRARLEAVRQRHASAPRRSMTFIVGRAAGRLEGIVVVGQGAHLNELIEIAGGRNVFAQSKMPYFKVSLEALGAADPEVIVDMGEMADTVGVTPERKAAVVKLWRASAPRLRATGGA
ncbi:MAG: ABC transporter substrate-binding protein, partial [Bryobacterales bacterium]|nr:ABC transporter substrate-binding protein [Bryobacterales bacterium]